MSGNVIAYHWDPIGRTHHLSVDDDGLLRWSTGYQDPVATMVGHLEKLRESLKDRTTDRITTARQERLKHFRKRFGPHITIEDLPKGEK